MPYRSITMTDSFQLRVQRSEEWRAVLMTGVIALMLVAIIFRRVSGDPLLASGFTFEATLAILSAGLMFECIALGVIRRFNLQQSLLPWWVWPAGAAVELVIPASILFLRHLESPFQDDDALSAPGLLIFPLIMVLSVLRLRPMLSLFTGIGAAVFHAALTMWAIYNSGIPATDAPMLFSYAIILGMTGLAASLVARAARGHVAESVREAQEGERASRRLATIEHDLAVAHAIQAGLLPSQQPNFPGFDIAGMNRPADETGGDYFDWQFLPNGRLGVVIADVTGHGIGPALVMAVCRAYARATSLIDAEPTRLLARLNDLLHDDLAHELTVHPPKSSNDLRQSPATSAGTAARFITLATAVLDRTGKVELLSAGHGPSLLFTAQTGQITLFNGDGIPLAILPEQTFGPPASLTMSQGDTLVMLTDGVYEWPDKSNKLYGLERLVESLRRAVSTEQTAARILEHLDREVRAFANGSKQADDVTIVVIRRTG